jgi:hypothetical protein
LAKWIRRTDRVAITDLTADVTFELQPPTTRPGDDRTILTDTVPIGEDPPGGSDDLDARRTYELEIRGAVPHPNQGYHVQLTVKADGSRGNDVKHKTFWVDCGAAATPTTTTATTATTTTSTTVLTETTAPTTATTSTPVGGKTPTATPPEAVVLGTTETREPPGTPPARADRAASHRSGPGLLTLGLASLLAGSALRTGRRRTR